MSRKRATKAFLANTRTHGSMLGSSVAGGVGFEPTTTDLGGRCSIRPELPAQHSHFMSMLKLDFSLNVDLFAMCTGVMTGNP